MENVYPPKYNEFLNISEEFKRYSEKILQLTQEGIPATNDELKAKLKLTSNDIDFESILESVDLDKQLNAEDDTPITSFDPSIVNQRSQCFKAISGNGVKLQCLLDLFKRQNKSEFRKLSRMTKYNKHRYLKPAVDTTPVDLQPNEDLIFSFRFYEPFKNLDQHASVSHHPRFQQEFFVLGSQTLAELRDRLLCGSNYGPFYDISESPDFYRATPPKTDGPGFFFVQNTFYNDTRNPNYLDYSQVIRGWATNQPTINELHTVPMQTTKFMDLKFNVSYPMVYVHQGNCEHLFTVSDVRLLSAQDSLVRINYPHLNSLSSSRSTFCVICACSEAKFMVKDSTLHMEDPAYLCANCFKSLHYLDGQKLGKFQAYYFYGNLLTQ